MNTVTKKYAPDILRFGLICGGLFAIFNVLLYVLEANIFSPWFGILNFLLMILFIVVPMVMGIRSINRLAGHPLNYGQKFLVALLIGFIGMLLSGIVSYLLYFVFDPEFMASMREQFMVDMETRLMNAGMSEEMLEMQMSRMVRQFERAANPVYTAVSSLITSVVVPAIVGLIVAASVNTRRFHEENVVIIEENQE